LGWLVRQPRPAAFTMKPWLERVARNTALRGEEPRNRFARWTARWFPPTPTVPASRFQTTGDPFPDHWREFPASWPPLDLAEHETRAALTAALDELPETWREVILARDARNRDAANVGQQLGLTDEQERAILNRARATVRDRLAQHWSRRADR
jgi:RNA polymerase sigma-70 factor, ECF subfamily